MKLRAVYFEHNVPIGDGNRVDSLHLEGDPWKPHAGWSALVRNEDASIVATKGARTITLDGYAYTYEAASEPAGEARAHPLASTASAADSGAAVDQGLTGAAGSTPARLAKGKRR